MWSLRADRSRGGPHVASQALVVRIGHHRLLRRHVQREAPGRFFRGCEALGLRRTFRRRDYVRRQTAQARLIGDDEFPRVGRVEHVVAVFLREFGEFGLKRFEPRALFVGQVGSRLAKVLQCLIHKPTVNTRQRAHRRRFRDGFKPHPKRRVERDARRESRDRRQQGVVRVAQRRRIRNRLQVGDLAPRVIEFLGGVLQREERIGVGQRIRRERCDDVDGGLRAGQRGFGGGRDEFRDVL